MRRLEGLVSCCPVRRAHTSGLLNSRRNGAGVQKAYGGCATRWWPTQGYLSTPASPTGPPTNPKPFSLILALHSLTRHSRNSPTGAPINPQPSTLNPTPSSLIPTPQSLRTRVPVVAHTGVPFDSCLANWYEPLSKRHSGSLNPHP